MPPNLVILRFYRIFAAEIKEIQNERIQKRIADTLLEYRLKEVGAVLIEGPKWCGKLPQQNKRQKRAIYGRSRQPKQLSGNGKFKDKNAPERRKATTH